MAYIFQVQVCNNQVFLKGLAFCDPLALLIHNDAPAVKNQIILAAHKVVKHEDDQVVLGPGGDHLLPHASFPGMEG